MIVVTTKLKKLPATCTKCKFSCNDVWTGRMCMASNHRPCPVERAPSGNTRYGKPDWCPLTVLEGSKTDA